MGFTYHKQDTQYRVNKHKYDFNADTVEKYISDRGGYIAYVKSLGGVFAKYAEFNYPTVNRKIGTKIQFEEICDYVGGLYDIGGVDYSNGCSGTYGENQYNTNNGGDGRFYPNSSPTRRFDMNYACGDFSNGADMPGVDEMLDPTTKYYAITNCAQGVCQAFKKAGLVPRSMPDPAYYPAYGASKGYNYTLIKDANKLQVGDVLLHLKKDVSNRSSRTTMGNGTDGLFHTNVVGEISKDKKTIYYYDAGHGYTYVGKCRYEREYGIFPYEYAHDGIAIRYDLTKKLSDNNYKGEEINGSWHCYEIKDDKTKIEQKGGKEIPGSKGVDGFYFNDKGEMLVGGQELNGRGGKSYFHFDGNGCMQTGWQKLKGSGGTDGFYFDPIDGYMYSDGLKKIKNKGYYFNNKGVMQTGTKEGVKVKVNGSGQLTGLA